MTGYVVAIPARYASTRLPGKPLASVGGMPMIRKVCLQALTSSASEVIACVDDERVAAALDGVGVRVCLTSQECKSGTDRIAEMARILRLDPETIIVNVQGDEPLIDASHIDTVAGLLASGNADMSTLCAKIENVRDVFDPNCVKVVFDKRGRALYFSRNPIPYERENFRDRVPRHCDFPHYHHIGIYGYRARTVIEFAALPQAPIERSESLEQLRLMYNGYSIVVGVTETPPEAGVDTREDLDRVNAILSRGTRA
ncbi:MAG: 3-deoxy-manno-octulosonate cytidylyltransferase [Succinivibrionaceae bacterium]|nr:3-deoxy-manno-octulosonate cytidylyltransferase [Succinivibrionaceae bacterium]